MDWLQFVINGGALVIVAAVIYYVFNKSTPDLIATFTGELRTQREAHNVEVRMARESYLEALRQQRSDFREELAAKRESVARLAETIEKLSAVVVEHDHAMRAAHDKEVRMIVEEIVRQRNGDGRLILGKGVGEIRKQGRIMIN